MNEILISSAFFGTVLTLVTYFIGSALQKRFRSPLLNPLLISLVLSIAFLLIFKIDYSSYKQSSAFISWLLTPTTVCLAIPLYEKLNELKKNWQAILIGVLSGALASLCSVFILSAVFRLDHKVYVSLLPKSITTAIGVGVAEELGGYASLTVIVIILTGILGNMCAEGFLALLRIREPIARGIAIGSASHAIGTARAMQLGETEGAMSGLSIALSGVFTVLLVNLFQGLL